MISHKNRSPKSERTYSSWSQLPSHLLTITLTHKVKLPNQSVNTNYKGYYNKKKTLSLCLSIMIITNDVTSNDTTKDIVPWDSDRCYTFHSCRPQTVHLISYMSIHQVWPVKRLHVAPILMNNTYAKERNLIFTILQLVNKINEILTIKKYQTQLQIRAIQRLQRLQIYQVPH